MVSDKADEVHWACCPGQFEMLSDIAHTHMLDVGIISWNIF